MVALNEETLASLEKSVGETGAALKSIGERLNKVDEAAGAADKRFKEADDRFKQVAADLAAAQKSLNEHIETTRAALKAIPPIHGGYDMPPIAYNSRADGTGFEFRDIRACKAFGLYLIARMSNELCRSEGMKGLERAAKEHNPWAEAAFKDLSTANFTAGGALVTEVFLPEIIRNVESHGHFTREARRLPMSGGTLLVPKGTGELTVYYPEENVPIPTSEPTFGDVAANARLYATLTKWSNTFSEDSAIDFGAYMAELIAFAHARARDLNGFMGDGASIYARVIGAMNHPSVVIHVLGNAIGGDLTNTGKTTFASLAYNDLVAAQGLLPTWAREGAKWYCHRFGAAVMRSLVDATGRPIFVTDYVNGKRVNRVLGDELVEVDVLPSASGATKDFILYGSMRQAYGYGEPRQIRIANSQEAGFAADQTWLRSTARVAMTAMDATALVKLRTSTT